MTPLETAIPNDLVAPHRVIHWPAHAANFSPASAPVHAGYRPRLRAAALVWHTPEEAVDDNEQTPRWFANPAAGASTDAYADSDGDLYMMVGDVDSPFANGVTAAQRHWKGAWGQRPPWATPGLSLNSQTRSIEIEGRAATMHRTFIRGGSQWKTVVAWSVFWVVRDRILVDREHLVGHEEFASHKRDPGLTFGFPIDDLVEDVDRATRAVPPLGAGDAMRRAYFGVRRWQGHRLEAIADDGRRERWELSFPSRARR
jgi:hypothetical protein